jgi:uncharacterized repeat protein (TIGR01451 family)/fimbrial isopeptide formation D2 family protein
MHRELCAHSAARHATFSHVFAMISDRFYFRRFFKKPAVKTPARKRLMETMEDRILFDAAPVVEIEAPAQIGVGQTAEVTVSFSNASTDAGYGPWVDVFIDATGKDGAADPLDPSDPQTGNLDGVGPLLTPGDQFDGFTLTGNPTYLMPSNGLNFTLLTLDSEANGGLGVLHPYATDQLGNSIHVDINGGGQIVYHNAATSTDTVIAGTHYQTGDQLLVIELPFGSYTQAQPPADITFALELSEFADVGQPLTLTAVGGFRYGNTPATDPAADPGIIGAGDAVLADVGVRLATLNKIFSGPANETATGENYVRTYRINIDIATGQALADLHVFDDLDPTIQFVGISDSSHAYTVIGSLPGTTVPGGELAVRFNDPVIGGAGGSDAWIDIQFYIPRVYDSNAGGTLDGADAAVLAPGSGDDRLVSNQAYGFGNWVPADPRDLDSAAIVGFNVAGTFDNTDLASALASAAPDGPAEHVDLEASPLVVQKNYTVVANAGASGNTPGDVLEFTLDFQLSDYFAFDDLVVADLLSDGLRFDSTFVPTLRINGNTYVLGPNGWTAANYTVSQNFTGATASGPLVLSTASTLTSGASMGDTIINVDLARRIAVGSSFTLNGESYEVAATTVGVDGGAGTITLAAALTANAFAGDRVIDGTTALTFRISDELSARAGSIVGGAAGDAAFAAAGKLLGGGVDPDDPSAPIANSGYTGGATTGRIVYRAIIQDLFTDDFPSGEPSVNTRDVLTNDAFITGTVLDLTTGAALAPHAVPAVSTDDASSSLTIASTRVTKTIHAVNGNTTLSVFQDANGRVNLQPGDVVTYRFQYTIPTGDIENLRFTDFLPLPILDVDNINADGADGGLAEWSFIDNTGNLAVASFAPGTLTYGPTHTLHTVTNPASPVPVLTINPGGNSVTMQWADFVNTVNDTKQVDILLSATVGSDPFADGLFLTNMVQSGEGNTQSPATESLANAIIQIVLNQPAVDIYKGVVASTQGGAAPATGGLTFSGTGAGNGFTGTLDSAADAEAIGALDLDALDAVDAGDLVRFAVVAQNTGRSDAFDVTVEDTLPGSFVNGYANTAAFVTGTNFAVYRGGDGTAALAGGQVDAFVRAASTANYATLTGVSNTVDGITLANGDRVLLKNQTTVSENGIYAVSAVNSTAGTMTLTFVPAAPAAVAVTGGAANGNKRFTEAAGIWTLDAASYDYFVSYDTAAKTFKVQLTDAYVTGNTSGDVNDGGLSRGYNPATTLPITNGSNAIVVLYDLTVATAAQASSTVTNTATLTNYAGADGTDDHTAEDEIESASLVIAAPTATKTLVGTSVTESGNAQYQTVVGETATYTVTINIPEGTTGQLVVTDILDSGLAFADLVSVTKSAGVTTDFSTFGDGAQTGTTDANAQVYLQNDGRTLVFNLGNIVTTGTAGASAQTVTITYTAVVLNITGNQSGTVLDNTAQVAWGWTNDSALPGLETEALLANITDPLNDVTVIEPSVTAGNSIAADNTNSLPVSGLTFVDNATLTVVAGQAVYYKVVLTNTGTVWAHDVSLYDRLPNVFNISATSIHSVVSTSGTTQFTAANFAIVTDTAFSTNKPAFVTAGTLASLAPGEVVTIILESRIVDDAVAASTHPNGIQVRWTSLDDDVRSADATDTVATGHTLAGSATPVTTAAAYNAAGVERTGANGPGTGLDNYAATDDATATVFQVQPVVLVKNLVGTQINTAGINEADDAVIGEYVDYTVAFAIPRGLSTDFVLTDILQPGLAFVEFLSVTVGEDIATHVDGTNTATSASLAFNDPGNLANLLAATTVTHNGARLEIDFGDIYNAEVPAAPGYYVSPQQITITYRALVTNVLANQSTGLRTNTATIDYTSTADSAPVAITASDTSDPVTIIEPTLSITTEVAKDTDGSPGSGTTPGTFGASTATPLDAGDYVYYRIRITNPAASSTTACDLQLSDAVPAFIDPLSLSVRSVALTTASAGVGGSLAGSVFDNATNLSTADFTFTGNTLGVTGTSNLDLGPDSTLEIIVRGTVASSVAPAQSATNNATIRWSSLDGATVAATSAYTTDDTERTGADATPAANTNASLPATGTSAPLNNYAATSANATTTASTVTLTKSIVATSEAHTMAVSGTERVAIGEIVRYRLVTTLPEGVSVSMLIRDNLPDGMLFVNDGTAMVALVADTATNISSSTFGTSASVAGDASTLASITPGYALDDDSVSKATGSDDDSWNRDDNPLFKLGTLTNAENDADAEYVVIEFNALVLNTAATGNQAGTTLGNNYEVFLNNSTAGGDKRGATSSTVNAIIAEPTLTVSQNVSTAGPVDAGDTFTYTLTIANTASGNNAAAAFDIRILDILDALTASNPGVEIELTVAPSGTAGGFAGGSVALTAPGYASVTANASDSTRVDLTLNRLNAGDSITLVVTATVKSGALAGAEIENKAVVTYTSLPGSGTGLGGSTLATALAGSTVAGTMLTTLAANTTERTGADSEATATDNSAPDDSAVRNNYAVAAIATSGLTVAPPALDLSWQNGTLTADDTSVGSSGGANTVIGETVTFDILVTLPEGVTDDLRVDVALPQGLRLDSYTVVTAAMDSTRLASDFNGTVDGTPAVTLPAAGPATVTFDFGDTTAVNDNAANNNAFVLRVTTTVVNALSNQAAVTRATTASLRYNDPDGSGNAGPAADHTVTDYTPANDPVVTLVEPTLTVTKGSVLPAGAPLDAGDVIDYTITLANTSGHAAYDVTLSDPIDSRLVVTAGVIPGAALTISGGATVSAGAFEIVDLGGGAFTLRTVSGANIDIPTGESVVITFSATVSNSIPPAATITNIANARWTSTDGANTDERGGSDVADTAPSTLNQALTTGALNNYALSSGVVNDAVNDITTTKAVTDSSIGNDTANAAPGELVTYRLTVTLPEGTVPGLRIRDAIPDGMAYVPGSLVLVTGSFVGSVMAPAVSPVSGITYGNGRDIEFDFSSITVTADNDAGTNTFSFTYQAVVLDDATNVDGALPGQGTLVNTAFHNNGTGSTFSEPAGSGSITVVEPVLSISKVRNTATADAGDTVTYTITVAHTAASTSAAYDLDVTDTLPAGFTATGYTATIATANDSAALFDLAGQAFTTDGTVNLALGQTLTIVITGTLDATVEPNQTINNAVSLTYDSHPGDITDRGNADVTTDRDRETSTSANVSLTTPFIPRVEKVLLSTSEAHTAGNTVAVGEIVRYEIRVELFEGTNRSLVIQDFLPAGLQFLPGNVEIAYESVTNALTGTPAAAGTYVATSSALVSSTLVGDADVYADGTDVYFKIGNVVNNDNDADREYVVIRYDAVVLNSTANQTAATHANNFGVLRDTDNNGTSGYVSVDRDASGTATGTEIATDADNDGSGGGDIAGLSNTITTTVAEPVITFTQQITSSVTGLDAGDTVTIVLTLSNAPGAASAFDFALSGTIDSKLDLTAVAFNAGATGASFTDTTDLGGDLLSGTIDRLDAGETVTVTLTAIVRDAVTPAEVLDAVANLTWTSLPGANGTASATPGAPGAATGERDGSSGVGSGLNNYAATDTDTATAVAPFVVTKALANTSLGADASGFVVIGEVLTYTVTVRVMEGTTRNIVLNDTLPSGLAFIANSASLAANGMTITGFDANTLDQTLSSVVNPGNTDAAGTSDTDTFTYTYRVRVLDIPANVAGVTRTNDIDASATNVTSDNNNQVTVTLTEPSLTLAKVTTATGADAGDAVVYTLTITNASGANVGTAYDINVTDLLDTNLELISTDVIGAVIASDTSTTGSLNLVLASLAPGATATITLNAVIKAAAPAGTTIANTASITYGTLPDGHPDEASERSDYTGSDTSAAFILATPLIDKQTPADTTYSIGEIVTCDLVITLPEGVTEDLVITDNLPAGLVYTGFQLVTTGFTGLLNTPTVANPSGNVHTFTFGDVTTTGNNNAGDNTFTLRVSARVANIADNQGLNSPAAATTFNNTASLQYTDGTDGTTTVNDASVPGAITAVEPVLQITKNVVTAAANLDAGDTVTYEIVVSHTAASTADAFDLLLADTLPAQLTGFTLDSALIGATNVAASFTLTAAGVLGTTAGAIDLAQGQSLTLRVSGVIRDTVAPGTDLNNTASLTYTSIDGPDANERDGSGGTNDYTATASAPELTTAGTLAVTKTADVTTAAIGDTVTYTVTITVPQGRTVVSLADNLPAGLVFVPGTAALTTPGGWTITGFEANTVNQTLTVTNPGTTDNAATLESASFGYTYEVLVQNVVGNQAGATRTNAIDATADLNNDGDTGDTGESDTDTDTVTLAEPSLSLTKISTTTGSDAGDAVVYTLTITNSNAANTSTAYDIRVRDLLDTDIELITADVTGAVIASDASTSGELNLVLQSLAPGATATITLNAVVKATAPAGATVANTASITYTSTPGDNPAERDGSGGTDDYSDSDTSASFTLATPVIDKLDSVTTTVAVGGTFSHDIDITLSEGVTRDLVITDLLPAGLILVGTSIDDSGFVGTLPSPVITGGLASGQDIVLNFGDVTTDDDNDTANNTFRVTVTVRAVNELASQAPATTFANTATLAYTHGTTLATATVTDPTAPDAVVLTEPVVTVDKTVTDDTTPHLGQTITYRIVLTNTGTSTAYDVVFADLIPAGLAGVAITGEVLAGGATLHAPGSGAAFNGTNTGLAGAYDIPVGGTVTITYTALVSSDPAVVGGTFNNADEDRNSSVTVTYSSLDGNPAGARDGADGSAGLNNYTATDDAPITLVGPGLRIDKTDGLASVTAGQTWDYTLTVSNVGTDTATGVVVTDLLPPQITLGQVRVNGVAAATTPVAGGFTVAVPDIAAGASATVVVTVTLDAVIDAAREDLTNTASVTHDDVEPTPADNTDDDTNVISATPGIGVVKTVSSVNGAPPALNGDGQPVVAPGDTVIYAIVLTNTGTQDVVVDITDTFPRIVLDLANATIDDSDTGVAASINLATGVIRWDNVALNVGETITITIEAEAFDPQLQALDTFPNTVLVSDITDEVPDEEDTVVADLSAFPDLVVTKVNSTDRIGINDIFTYTITLTNAGDQNAENVTVVDTLPPFVEFIGASGNFIFDPVARTVTWNSAGNPELAIVNGRGAETITHTLTVKLPLNSIVFGDLANTVRAFDDGTNGPDLNPADNEDTQTTDVLGFLYDTLRNFSRTDADEDDNDYELGLPIEVYRDAILPIAPIYSGAAEPGSTLEVVLYNADGNVLGRQTVVVDTGGNWMASFPGTIMKDYPQSVVITQTPAAASSDGSSQGYNLRPYYATAINAGHFFRENLNVSRVTEQTPTRVTDDLQEALSNPIGFAVDAASYESLASPGHPTGR